MIVELYDCAGELIETFAAGDSSYPECIKRVSLLPATEGLDQTPQVALKCHTRFFVISAIQRRPGKSSVCSQTRVAIYREVSYDGESKTKTGS